MLFGEIALSFLHSPTTERAAKDFIIAKLTPLCGSIGAFNKQQNENNAAGVTLTASQLSNFTPAGPVAELHNRLAWPINESRCFKPKDSIRDSPNCSEIVVAPDGAAGGDITVPPERDARRMILLQRSIWFHRPRAD